MRRRISLFCFLLLSGFISFPCGARSQGVPDKVSASWTPVKLVAIIPFELYHNRVYLPVSVNGSRTYAMILDTGAADTLVSEEVAA